MARYIMSLNRGGKPSIVLKRRRIGVNLLFAEVSKLEIVDFYNNYYVSVTNKLGSSIGILSDHVTPFKLISC